jgi:hypothetical protein
MNIGEFFVLLGVKGADQSAKAVGSVTSQVKDLGSQSLAAKAALVGVVYGLERMMSQSATAGMSLLQFSKYTGLSTQTLQEYQYAGRQFGIETEEMTSSLKGLQSVVANMQAGMGAPAGLQYIGELLGDLDEEKIKDSANGVFYLFQKLQEASQKGNTAFMNEQLRSLVGNEKIIAGMRANIFTKDMFSKAPKYNEAQINSLAKTDVMMGNVKERWNKAFGFFTAKHGQQIASGINTISGAVINLLNSLMQVAEKFHIFEWIGKMITGWANLLNLISGKDSGGATGGMEGLKLFLNGIKESAKDSIKSILPSIPESSGPSSMNNIEQNLYFNHDGRDALETASSTRTAFNQAFRQMPQGQIA